MPIAERLQSWLDGHHAEYSTITHSVTSTSTHTAEAAHIPGGKIAKAVVLKTTTDSYLLMVLPADHKVHLGRLHRLLHDNVCLATEAELAQLFPDCAVGAIPAMGEPYGLRTLVDNSLWDEPVVFLESGDHETLLQLGHHQFHHLLQGAERVEAVKHI